MTSTDAIPGGLVYLSETKLYNLARSLGASTASTRFEMSVAGAGSAKVPLAPGTGLSAEGRVLAERVQPQRHELTLEKLLAKVVRTIERDDLPDLDKGKGRVREGGWFRFHRRLRFGVGTDNDRRSVRALVLVDREPVPAQGFAPGLLMTGSPVHLWPPYYSEKLCKSPGARSGSGSGTLFAWLHETAEALARDPSADIDALRAKLAEGSRERADAPWVMYDLFSQDDWMGKPRFPAIVHHSPCEGIAQASLIAVDDTPTIVMGSPLYVRVRALPEANCIGSSAGPVRTLGKIFSRRSRGRRSS